MTRDVRCRGVMSGAYRSDPIGVACSPPSRSMSTRPMLPTRRQSRLARSSAWLMMMECKTNKRLRPSPFGFSNIVAATHRAMLPNRSSASPAEVTRSACSYGRTWQRTSKVQTASRRWLEPTRVGSRRSKSECAKSHLPRPRRPAWRAWPLHGLQVHVVNVHHRQESMCVPPCQWSAAIAPVGLASLISPQRS
jgi:hypothetical protein